MQINFEFSRVDRGCCIRFGKREVLLEWHPCVAPEGWVSRMKTMKGEVAFNVGRLALHLVNNDKLWAYATAQRWADADALDVGAPSGSL